MTTPRRDDTCSWRVFLVLVVVSAVFHGISWVYPWGWFGAWVGQAALLLLAVNSTPRRAFLGGWLIGCAGLGWAFHWATAGIDHEAVVRGMIWNCIFGLLVAWEALSIALLAWGASRLARRGLVAFAFVPLWWAAIEYWSFRVMPWMMGYTQVEQRPLIQIAAIGGATSIGALLTCVASTPAAWFVARRHHDASLTPFLRYASAVAGVAALWIGGGYWQIAAVESDGQERPLRVGIAQVNPSLDEFYDPLLLATSSLSEHVDLMIWPESTLGTFDVKLEHLRDEDHTIALSHETHHAVRPCPEMSCDLIAGGRNFGDGATDPKGPYYVAAMLINRDEEIRDRYFKRVLMPFGEYAPLGPLNFLIQSPNPKRPDFLRGQSSRPLTTSRGDKIGVVICYEDTLPASARATVLEGAQMLVSIVNDGGFKSPLTLEQHYRLAFLRAVENRRWFARASTTGVSAMISPTGKVVHEVPVGVEMTTPTTGGLRDGLSIYTRFGDWFPWLATIVALIAVGRTFRERGDASAMDDSSPAPA